MKTSANVQSQSVPAEGTPALTILRELKSTVSALQSTVSDAIKILQAFRTESVRDGLSEFLDVEQAAAFLGMKRQTLYKYLSEGRLKRYKRGKRVFVRRAELEQLAGVPAQM